MLFVLLSLCLLFNKIGKEGRTVSAWKWEVWGERGLGERWPKQCIHISINE
jgi:hypothetical protein